MKKFGANFHFWLRLLGIFCRVNLGLLSRFEKFCVDNDWWLEDFVLFDILRKRYDSQSWKRWPSGLARRESAPMAQARTELKDELNIGRVIQFLFYEQWLALRAYCTERAIRVVGDIAIFVDYDSADVWANRDIFRLRDDLEPEVVAGVPPDAFSVSGRRWGNPLYNWDVMRTRGYQWWIRRLRWATQTCDYIRLDHFSRVRTVLGDTRERTHGSQRAVGSWARR